MKVSIQNLGAVKQAEIEIKPLTVFVGENGTGKTWAAYSLAGILGKFGFLNFTGWYLVNGLRNPPRLPEIEQAVQKVIEEGNAQIDVVQFAENHAIECFNAIADYAPAWLPTFLSTPKGDFSKTQIRFSALDISDIARAVMGTTVSQGLSFGQDGQPKLSMSKESGDKRLFIITASADITSIIPKESIRANIVNTLFLMMQQAVFGNVTYLPIGRITMATEERMYPQISHEEVSADRIFTADVEASSILRHTLKLISTGRDEEVLNQEDRQDYVRLSQLLEEGVLRGGVSYKQSALNYWNLYYNFGGGRSLELRAASSMVKELALLVLYLRYLAQKNDVIVIDEPEMNLHPEAQARMTELLCMMVNAGLNVIVTTHSSYIVDHLANLLKAAKSSDKAGLAERFFLKDERAFIAQDKVSVYHFENGSAHSILDEDGYIDWKTFSDVTERLLRLADIVEDYQGVAV